ncbi:MAG: hypothetical protein SNH88_07755 [Rikenellaceae bacterium]
MRLTYTKIIAALLLLLSTAVGHSQQQEIEVLEGLGLENIRVVKDGSVSYIALEDNVYRGVARGVAKVVDALYGVDSTQTYNLLIEEDGVARVAIAASSKSDITASNDTEYLVDKLRGEKVHNSSFGRLAIVFYPELFLENSWYDKLYGVAVNISPAAELSLWPGAMFTAQVVIPIYTNMQDEKQYIRPGVIAFRQDLRLMNQLYGSISIGNFTDDRMGIDATLDYYTKDGSWNFGARAGLTGSSTFYGGEWVVSIWRRVTWSGWTSYYVPRYNLAIKGEAMQMIYGDVGVRGSLQRYFKDVSIGLYAMITGGYTNGGFTFSAPLPGKRRSKRDRRVEVTYPEYFTRVYRARNGVEALKGFSYETSPDAGSFGNFYNPQHINNYINQF